MKKIFAILAIILFLNINVSADAGYVSDKRSAIKTYMQVRADKKAIKNVINLQNKYASKYDYDSMFALYSEDFVSADGFDKNTYFELIKDTWKSYPDITYTTNIKDICVDKDSATVSVHETSSAATTQMEDGAKLYGELNSYSNGKYFLKKGENGWLITGEVIADEKSVLKYGDMRYVDVDLNSPRIVKPGEYYTATLTVDAPDDSVVVASIGRDNITYPQEQAENVFRKLPTDKILERMFFANKDGKNEYNVASVGMTKSKIEGGNIELYLAGIGFVMTRVNVEVDDAKKDK